MERINYNFSKPITYAAWTKDADIRYHSTSGGAFTEFAKVIISEGGYVAGAQYNSDCLVEHTLISDFAGVERLRQSKYIQSNLNNIYKQVKDKLDEGKIVGFCGAPCQVAGLYAYLGKKEYTNLFTMDFICRGMNSPKAFKAWLVEIEAKENSKAKKVWFKYKDGGWKTSPRRTRVDFEDGHFQVYEGENNLFMHGYLSSNLYIKPSCGNCVFKGLPRYGDVTFADFWGIEAKYDDDKGTSLLLVNSEKGQVYFDKIKENMEYYQKDFDDILDGNPMFTSSVAVPENAHLFLEDLDRMSFTDALMKYGGYPVPIPFGRKVLRKLKRVIKKLIGR